MAKIAIIDDDPDIVEAIRTLLELNGHEVVSASDIDTGYELVSNEKPDIVILAMKLRKNGFSMPIIMLTSVAKATGMDFGTGGSVPVNEFLEKPIQSNVLISLINDYLSF